MLSRKKAEEYIGDLKEKVTDGTYTGVILTRKKRGVKYFNIADGVIFNTGGGRFGYKTKKDGKYVIALDHSEGRKKDIVDEEKFLDFQIAINDDCPAPFVLFDKNGDEAAIVYLPRHIMIRQKFTKDEEVVIKLKEGKR
jgi:hypothetical protein